MSGLEIFVYLASVVVIFSGALAECVGSILAGVALMLGVGASFFSREWL